VTKSRPREEGDDDERDSLAAVGAERLLLPLVQQLTGERVLCTSLGRAQFAAAASAQLPSAHVICSFLDGHRAELARAAVAGHANLAVECASDFPPGEFDVVALPSSARGEAELTREQLQEGHERLRLGGLLLAATDNRDDRWLHGELRELFDGVTRQPGDGGIAYIARKTRPLRRRRDFSCEFAFRDRGRLIRAVSRPGVFSHRRIDGGARALIDAMDIASGERAIDIGCGAGTVALAAACLGARVHAVDSSARAVACTARGAELNAVEISVELEATGHYAEAGSYDLALANPPYYGAFRIARLFLEAARRSLRAGGRLLLVTKSTEWYECSAREWFAEVRIETRGEYALVRGIRAA
jgi:16S rRNA (guanine1207-N2)-methyltransferase